MSAPSPGHPAACPVGHGRPPALISDPQIAAEHDSAREMYQWHKPRGPVVGPWPTRKVTKFHNGLAILQDEDRYPADPSVWAQRMQQFGAAPADLALLGPRPDALHTKGIDRQRYRKAIYDALTRVGTHQLGTRVSDTAEDLIAQFCGAGEADLIAHYARPLVIDALHGVLGFAPETEPVTVEALDKLHTEVDAGRSMLRKLAIDAVVAKRASRADDVASWLLEHPVGLSEGEIADQLVLLCGFLAPTWALIGNAVLRSLTDDQFGGAALAGSLSAEDALEEVLRTNSPIPIAAPRFPLPFRALDETGPLHPHEPLLIDLAACNVELEERGGNHTGNRAHLSFGAGVHECPAESLARMIGRTALMQLWDILPELHLAISPTHLEWVPDPFVRALVSLPVHFPPVTGTRIGRSS